LKVNAAPIIDRAAGFQNLNYFTEDTRIAAEAFLAKEKPRFTGR
jgi:hypothetical protein